MGWPAAGGDVTVSGINLPLIVGGLYGATVDFVPYSGPSVHYISSDVYPGGNGLWSFDGVSWTGFSDLDTAFRAEFGSTSVPEPSTFMIAAVATLSAFGYRRFRRNLAR